MSRVVPLALRQATRASWLPLCQEHLPVLLSDHVHCERKAAASALSFVCRAPDDAALVTAMAALAREEAGHLARVHTALKERGWPLLVDRKDHYVLGLRARIRRGHPEQFADELLTACMVELRSAERLGILAAGLEDAALRSLYEDLALSEDGHASLFLERARAHAADVDARLDAWLDMEAELMVSLPAEPRIHG